MADLLAIDIDAQTAPLVVALAVLVPKDGDVASVVGNVVKTEPIPLPFRDERIDLDGVVVAWTQTYETGNHEVVESRVIVVAAALLITFEPVAGHFVKILADVGTATVMLRLLSLLGWRS